jgi:hypothetical protein
MKAAMYCEKIPDIDLEENWPTSIAHAVFCHGTKLVSRYRKQHEFRIMIQMAEVIRCRASTARVEEIYCDSQSCAGYRVGGSRGSALQVAWLIEQFCVLLKGGHNGIFVKLGADEVELDPEWGGFEGEG